MKYILFFAIMFSACCRHRSEETTNPLDQLHEKLAFYVEHAGQEIFLKRCDNLTFKSFWDAHKQQDLPAMEWLPGEWHRDAAACWPEESRSEISRDGLIALLHALHGRGDLEAVQRIEDYGKANMWVMGQGDLELVHGLVLSPAISALLHEMSGLALAGEQHSEDEIPALEGHRGHVTASYIWLMGKIRGWINTAELAFLYAWQAENPLDPMALALTARFSDGDQTDAISVLGDERLWPSDSVPLADGYFGWGSCPAVVYYGIVMSILSGR